MKIEHFGKDYNYSDHLKEVTEKKCRKLKKYFSEQSVAKFTVTLDKKTYITDLVVTDDKGNIFRARSENPDPYTNVDEVIPKLEGQMRKQKSSLAKIIRDAILGKKQNSAPKIEIANEDEEPPKPEV